MTRRHQPLPTPLLAPGFKYILHRNKKKTRVCIYHYIDIESTYYNAVVNP